MLGLHLYIFEAEHHAGLDLVFWYALHALMNVIDDIRLDALHQLLQDKLLVLAFDLKEIGLDAVEVGALGHVEDHLGSNLLAGLSNFLGFVYPQVVHEDRELTASGSLREHLDEL